MPFRRFLLPDAILLRLDGIKKLASANSDFEIFNGLEASTDIVHYEYEKDYPRSLIPHLTAGGRPVEVFHGLPAGYMNLKAAYKLQGSRVTKTSRSCVLPASGRWTAGGQASSETAIFSIMLPGRCLLVPLSSSSSP